MLAALAEAAAILFDLDLSHGSHAFDVCDIEKRIRDVKEVVKYRKQSIRGLIKSELPRSAEICQKYPLIFYFIIY